jgi:hypothetical protein
VKVDTEKDVLKKTRNDQNNVEHGPETVDVLWNIQKARSVALWVCVCKPSVGQTSFWAV